MKRLAVGTLVLLLAGGMGYLGFHLAGLVAPEAAVAASVDAEAPGLAVAAIFEDRIEVDARVVPVRNASLSLPVAGIVAEVLVAEGQPVEENQVLVRLHADRQTAALAQAKAAVDRAQARLDETRSGARSQEIASAQADRDAAQARFVRLTEGAQPAEVAAAAAGLAAAQASLQKVLEGPEPPQLIVAEAELANAQAALQQAQAAYDQVKWRNDVAQLPQSMALWQATNNFEAARARLDDLQQGAGEADIAFARAEVVRAQAQLAALTEAHPADLTAAEAEVRRAQAQLELLEVGARAESIAMAEADLAAAMAAMAQAMVALVESELRAPFAGTVASLDVAEGEQVAAGTPVLHLADLSTWQIETEDLTEFAAVRISEGASATIRYDALPGLEQSGQVKRIRPLGQNNRGDIVYTVVVEPNQQNGSLLWNMTAVIVIDAPALAQSR